MSANLSFDAHTDPLGVPPSRSCWLLPAPGWATTDSPHTAMNELPPGVLWYAVWTRSRHEIVVRDQLQEREIEAFLPTIRRWSRWKDRKKQIDWPLFPGYCFARFDAAESLRILKCNGVVSIVSFDSRPAPVDEAELESIRLLVNSDLQFDACPFLKEGTMVEVTSGPLRGVRGRLLRKVGGRARLVLSVDLINQAVAVEVDAADVKSP
jgi:transcription antitermination factor NusG